eukprot:1139053-Pelagomonas_calceolata.AAC.1
MAPQLPLRLDALLTRDRLGPWPRCGKHLQMIGRRKQCENCTNREVQALQEKAWCALRNSSALMLPH